MDTWSENHYQGGGMVVNLVEPMAEYCPIRSVPTLNTDMIVNRKLLFDTKRSKRTMSVCSSELPATDAALQICFTGEEARKMMQKLRHRF